MEYVLALLKKSHSLQLVLTMHRIPFGHEHQLTSSQGAVHLKRVQSPFTMHDFRLLLLTAPAVRP